MVAVALLDAGGSGNAGGSDGAGDTAIELAKPRRIRLAAAVVLVVIGPMAWGVWRAGTIEFWPAARVALLQTNLSQSVRLDPERVLDETFASLDRLVTTVQPGSIDIAVAPEMLLPLVPAEDDRPETLQRYARELGAPILFGARGPGAAGEQELNSVYLMEPGGLSDFRWDKHHLVPIVERPVLLTAALRGAVGAGGADDGFREGTGWPIADAAGAGFGAMICFESAFAGVARDLRRAGADVLVNVTNDAWFGDELGDARTAALWQHPAHLVMRAIETRSAVVRVGNAGFSFWVDPVGRVHDVIDLFVEAAAVVEVQTSDVETVFVRFGDVLGNASGLSGLVLLLASFAGRPGRRQPERAWG